ncbi:hypothetical protein QUA42_08795 [Microcoleus sp. Pol11C2]
MQGFVGHDRILVVLAVILAKETLFDRKESSTFTANRPVGWHSGSQPTVGIITLQRPPLDRPGDRLFCLMFSAARSQSYY